MSFRPVLFAATLSLGLGVPTLGRLAWPAPRAAPGVIVGTVVTAGTLEPLAFSAVSIVALARVQAADGRGRFVFSDVPPGPAILLAKRIGFNPASTSVTVPSGDTVRIRIELTRLATSLPPTTTIACKRTGTSGHSSSPPAPGNRSSSAIEGALIDNGAVAAARTAGSATLDSAGHDGSSRTFTIDPALAGKTTWNLDTDGEFDIGMPGSWTITPRSTFEARAMLWGGGGGGAFSGGGVGGGGGYSVSTLTFRAGVTYTIVVGGGGQGSQVLACGGDGGFGGGGAGGGVQPPGEGIPGSPFLSGGAGQLGDGYYGGAAGGGGGLSGVFTGTQPSQKSALVIAGGGGGGTFVQTNGGAGGGLSGEAGEAVAGGGAGTQHSAGVAGHGGALPNLANLPRVGPNGRTPYAASCVSGSQAVEGPVNGKSPAESSETAHVHQGRATDGSAGSGGGGGFANGCGAGGGGGGGYFGGGGGGQNRGGGGGGSGLAVAGSTVAGKGSMPGNASDPRNGGAGAGATTSGNDGAPGRVIIHP